MDSEQPRPRGQRQLSPHDQEQLSPQEQQVRELLQCIGVGDKNLVLFEPNDLRRLCDARDTTLSVLQKAQREVLSAAGLAPALCDVILQAAGVEEQAALVIVSYEPAGYSAAAARSFS